MSQPQIRRFQSKKDAQEESWHRISHACGRWHLEINARPLWNPMWNCCQSPFCKDGGLPSHPATHHLLLYITRHICMWHTTCGCQDSRCPFSYAILNAFFLRHNDAMFMFDKHLIFAENKTLGFGTHTQQNETRGKTSNRCKKCVLNRKSNTTCAIMLWFLLCLCFLHACILLFTFIFCAYYCFLMSRKFCSHKTFLSDDQNHWIMLLPFCDAFRIGRKRKGERKIY